MGITRFKRIQNLDVTVSQFNAIETYQRELRITRAKLLRILIDVALEHPDRIREKSMSTSLFAR